MCPHKMGRDQITILFSLFVYFHSYRNDLPFRSLCPMQSIFSDESGAKLRFLSTRLHLRTFHGCHCHLGMILVVQLDTLLRLMLIVCHLAYK